MVILSSFHFMNPHKITSSLVPYKFFNMFVFAPNNIHTVSFCQLASSSTHKNHKVICAWSFCQLSISYSLVPDPFINLCNQLKSCCHYVKLTFHQHVPNHNFMCAWSFYKLSISSTPFHLLKRLNLPEDTLRVSQPSSCPFTSLLTRLLSFMPILINIFVCVWNGKLTKWPSADDNMILCRLMKWQVDKTFGCQSSN